MLKRERRILVDVVSRMNLLLHSVKPTHIRQDMAACVFEIAELAGQGDLFEEDEDDSMEVES